MRDERRNSSMRGGGYGGGYGGEGEDEDVIEVQPRGPFSGVGPKNYQRSDERIREDVCDALCDSPDLDAREIDVRVEEGVVFLEGKVDGQQQRRLAEDIALEVRGVQDVRDNLVRRELEKAQRREENGI